MIKGWDIGARRFQFCAAKTAQFDEVAVQRQADVVGKGIVNIFLWTSVACVIFTALLSFVLVRMIGISTQFAQFYGGTSLLILVGVVLDTLQQIESHLLMRHYDGLTKSGRIKGRSAAGGIGM